MHTVIDLLSQTEFVRWVQNPDEELNAFWKQWLIAHPDRLNDVKLAREFLVGIKSTPLSDLPQHIKEEILIKILQDDLQDAPVNSVSAEKSFFPLFSWYSLGQFYRVAGVLFIGILAAFLYAVTIPSSEEPIHHVAAVEWITKKTTKGEKLKFTLPDSTEVWLNSSSELLFPKSFEGSDRMVKLSGEAFFDVYPDSVHPFIVDAQGLLTKAVGTSFTVAKDPEKQLTKVSLATGKVYVSHSNVPFEELLAPGEQLVFNEAKKKASIGAYDWKKEVGWKDGWLVFNNASYEQVLQAIEEWYGVQVTTLNSPSRKWDYSGEYHRQTLDNILASMAFIEKFKYTINDNTVTIKF
jgi:ferric-dicitrate binding protein FerR (iron transport regulator)